MIFSCGILISQMCIVFEILVYLKNMIMPLFVSGSKCIMSLLQYFHGVGKYNCFVISVPSLASGEGTFGS